VESLLIDNLSKTIALHVPIGSGANQRWLMGSETYILLLPQKNNKFTLY
jgi:hypothetical protein